MSGLQGYVKGALPRKQLIAFFVEQFQLTLKNTGCFEFQFHVGKLSYKKCIIQGAYYTGLSTIDGIDSLFGRAPQGKPWKQYKHYFLVSCYKIWSKVVF